jgi:hypothetical protein
MKTEIKFNHKAESMLEALGIKMTDDQMLEVTFKAITNWIDAPDGGEKSKLAEQLHKLVPYEVILLMATRDVHSTLKESVVETNPLERLFETLEKIINKSEGDKIRAN